MCRTILETVLQKDSWADICGHEALLLLHGTPKHFRERTVFQKPCAPGLQTQRALQACCSHSLVCKNYISPSISPIFLDLLGWKTHKHTLHSLKGRKVKSFQWHLFGNKTAGEGFRQHKCRLLGKIWRGTKTSWNFTKDGWTVSFFSHLGTKGFLSFCVGCVFTRTNCLL